MKEKLNEISREEERKRYYRPAVRPFVIARRHRDPLDELLGDCFDLMTFKREDRTICMMQVVKKVSR